MEKKIDGLPNWTFWIDEVSAGVYRVKAKHVLDSVIELTGTDPEELLERAKGSARELDQDIHGTVH